MWPITVDSVFESGSVAKQFTAASLALLEIDGKLDIDDPVKKYIPELPDYGAPLTIRHLLNHTAGLRDWGAVLGISGVGRGERIVRQGLAMHVITRQKNLDFKPGAEYSYSNSGYTLASTIVERVSKKSLAEFTEERIFKPLGMGNTSWRTDYQKLVPRRTQAYVGSRKGPWRLSMPFMNVYGNGGILTTIGDFLKWNAALDSGEWATMVAMLERRGVLNDGRTIDYALGLNVGKYKGLNQIAHGGRTAGYVTYLARYPELGLSVVVLCNAPTNSPAGITHRIIDEVAGPAPEQPKPKRVKLSVEELKRYAGLWRHDKRRVQLVTTVEEGKPRLRIGRTLLHPLGNGVFQAGNSPVRFKFRLDSGGKRISVERRLGDDVRSYLAVERWSPKTSELRDLEGFWYSDEADAKIELKIKNGKALVVLPSLQQLPLVPQYKDHFSVGPGSGSIVWVVRDNRGKIKSLHVGTGRMRNLPFQRVKG